MGLDIVYCRKATLVPTTGNDEPEGTTYVYVNGDFPGRAEPLCTGCYTTEDSAHFRAGSYGGYNHWRNALCVAARGITAEAFWAAGSPNGPFKELVNFSDCDGVIGPVVSKKLAADFATYTGAPIDDSGLFDDFRKAFETAADGGFVKFC